MHDNAFSAVSDPAIEVRSVGKSFGDSDTPFRLFENLNLTIGRNERLAIFGANGSGKSTLLRILAGLTEPDTGEVLRASNMDASIGYVFQGYDQSLMPWLSCIDNVGLPIAIRDEGSWREARTRASEFLAELKIQLPLDRYPYQMSGGQKQLAVIARALIVQPTLFLLDEPFASLDYLNRLNMLGVLEVDWERRPKTTVFVSHDVDEALLVCDRLVVLGGQPSRFVDSIEVPLSRPRTAAAISSAVFGDLRDRVLRHFPTEAR